MHRSVSRFVVAVLGLALGLSGCYSISDYNGDGVIAKTTGGSSKYRLFLKEIDLSVEGEHQFELRGLPSELFTVGLEVERLQRDDTQSILYTRPLDADVSIVILNERHETVVEERGSLSNWVWSGGLHETDFSFLYRRGASVDVPNEDGGVTIEFVGLRPDAGWGTYFTPRSGGRYNLIVTVVVPDTRSEGFRVVVVAYGGERFVL